MILHLIAAIFAAFGMAGIALFIRFVTKNKAPKWIIPVFAGIGMLGYQIQHEYMWFDQKKHQLPEYAWFEDHTEGLPHTIEVIDIERSSMVWRPWTYIFPMISAFSLVDRSDLRVTDTEQGRLVEYRLYRIEKHVQDVITHQEWLINCSNRETLPLVGPSRSPHIQEMRRLTEESSLYRAVCTD